MAEIGTAERWLPRALAGLSAAFLIAAVLYYAGRPVATDDVWWHLTLGRSFVSEGLWPESDPSLFTAHEEAPQLHSWLFGVAVYGLERAFGLAGLRVVHVLGVAGILWLAHSLFRRQSGSRVACFCALAVFVVMSWQRLFQLRPDLFSIPATFLVYRLLLEDGEPPSWRRVAAATGLLLVWANVHALFAVGPLLVVAALLGVALRALLARWAASRGERVVPPGRDGALARRIGLALAAGLLATLANPRGFAQHLTYFTGLGFAIKRPPDDFSPFFPFSWREASQSLLAWAATDLLLLLFFATAVWAFWRFARSPSARALRVFDPVLFGLGCAAFAAMFGAVRFLWMAVFPLLFLLRLSSLAASEPQAPLVRTARVLATALTVCLAVAFPSAGGFTARASNLPSNIRAYLGTPFALEKYDYQGVEFLRLVEAEGRLYNPYYMGGFLGYWLSPRLRVFIDGRSMDYPRAVFAEAFAIQREAGVSPGESFVDVLERRSVDWFFGRGFPFTASRIYTTSQLEGVPGWIPVSRSIRHGIYLRAHPRNQANLERIAAYYERQGVPFDSEGGLDVSEVIRARPDWAEANGLLPRCHSRLLEATTSSDPKRRFAALDTLAWTYALIGAYDEQVAADRRAAALRPGAPRPQRRLAFGLLKLGRWQEARDAVNRLLRLAPADPRSRYFAGAVGSSGDPVRRPAITRLPVMTLAERDQFLTRFSLAPCPREDDDSLARANLERAQRQLTREPRGS